MPKTWSAIFGPKGACSEKKSPLVMLESLHLRQDGVYGHPFHSPGQKPCIRRLVDRLEGGPACQREPVSGHAEFLGRLSRRLPERRSGSADSKRPNTDKSTCGLRAMNQLQSCLHCVRSGDPADRNKQLGGNNGRRGRPVRAGFL